MAPSSSSPAISRVFFFFLALLLLISLSAATTGNGGSFSTELIHRDSPRSPFYDPSSTHSDRLRAAFRRSSSRVDYFKNSIAGFIQSHLIPNSFEYLMTLSLGTSPFKILAIADTGSDLIWTQCKPCDQCYKQDAPMFDPSNSLTYSDQSCNSDFCSNLPPPVTCGGNDECEYTYSYGDGSYVAGVLASETFTFDSTENEVVSVPKMIFGCTHESNGTFDSHGSGLVGLGGGPLSLISQLGSSINGKFSYCLVPLGDTNSSSSLLIFGKAITGQNVVSTPIITNSDLPTFYYLTLEGITVDSSEVVPTKQRASQATGEKIIIDSGTTLTYISSGLLEGLLSTLKSRIGIEPIADPNGEFQLCYPSNIQFPDITFQFTGASMVLKPINTFAQTAEGVVCLVILSNENDGGPSIFGNIAQQNFEIGYDLVEKKLSFAPKDCTQP